MRVATVVGFDYHVGMLCNKVNANSESWRFVPYSSTKLGILRAALSLGTAEALIKFGGSAPHPIHMAVARAFKVPMFVIWAGSDVTRALSEPAIIPEARRTEIVHLAVAPWLVEELKQAGIKAQYLPIIGFRHPTPTQIPTDQFNVLTYLPEPRRDFYGRPHIYEVAAKMPDCNFIVVGAGDADSGAPSNVQFKGLLPDITALLDQCVAVLRVPEHDGMSLMVLEALARGRFVAWNHSISGVKEIKSVHDTIHFLRALQTDWLANALGPNLVGSDFIATKYDEHHVALGVQQFLDHKVDVISDRKQRSRQIAISGLDMFVADVADMNNQLKTGWSAQVLQFETPYELVGSLFNVIRSDVLYTIGTPVLGRAMTLVSGLLNKPRVMHWVGTDIEAARRDPDVAQSVKRPWITHLTEAEWEAEDLRSLGINAAIAPLPPRFSGPTSVPPLPVRFTVLTYLPRSRTHFYGKRELEAIVKRFMALPIQFLIVGGGDIDVPEGANVENLGWRYTLTDIYERSTVLFRFTPRDGLSLMVLEALSFGRHVLWTKRFPFVKQIHSIEASIASLQSLLESHQNGLLEPQWKAVEFVHDVYSREHCIRQIAATWDSARGSNGAQIKN